MADIDVPVKRLMQSRIQDWVQFLVPECQKNWITEIDPSKAPAKKESRLDKLILIDSPKETFILNIEPQGYLDRKMPARMLRYRADIWEYTLEIGLRIPSIKQAVIYFYKEHDNKQNHLVDEWEGEQTLNFSYKVIKIWEIPSDQVIKNKLEGLYPLLPLMHRGLDTEEERQEAALEATRVATKKVIQDNIISLLESKFELVPGDIRRKINAIEDTSVLKGLFKKALTVSSIENFSDFADKIVK